MEYVNQKEIISITNTVGKGKTWDAQHVVGTEVVGEGGGQQLGGGNGGPARLTWWMRAPGTVICPLSKATICSLPNPPFKLRVKLNSPKPTVCNRWLDKSDADALDNHLQRHRIGCDFGRHGFALTRIFRLRELLASSQGDRDFRAAASEELQLRGKAAKAELAKLISAQPVPVQRPMGTNPEQTRSNQGVKNVQWKDSFQDTMDLRDRDGNAPNVPIPNLLLCSEAALWLSHLDLPEAQQRELQNTWEQTYSGPQQQDLKKTWDQSYSGPCYHSLSAAVPSKVSTHGPSKKSAHGGKPLSPPRVLSHEEFQGLHIPYVDAANTAPWPVLRWSL